MLLLPFLTILHVRIWGGLGVFDPAEAQNGVLAQHLAGGPLNMQESSSKCLAFSLCDAGFQ